jgi:hypothetical protein
LFTPTLALSPPLTEPDRLPERGGYVLDSEEAVRGVSLAIELLEFPRINV